MAVTGQGSRHGEATGRRPTAAWRVAMFLLIAGCSGLGPPPMEPLTGATLEAARRRWAVHGTDSYRLVVRVRAPRVDPTVYDVEVARGALVGIERDGKRVGPEAADHSDYSVLGLFEFLRQDLRWTDVEPIGDTPAVDLRAYFEPETGRLVRYRRTVGTTRRRVLLVEVLAYEPVATLQAGAAAPRESHGGG